MLIVLAMTSKGEAVSICVLEGVVCGHHNYKETWTPTVEEHCSSKVRQPQALSLMSNSFAAQSHSSPTC